MSEDILAHWKKERFVLVPFELLDKDETLIILTDIAYWAEHEKQLTEWCNWHNVNVEGMCITFPNPQTLTLFTLRWS